MMRIIATMPAINCMLLIRGLISLIGSHDISNTVSVHSSNSFTMFIPVGFSLHTIWIHTT